ncbi:unnamed protein product [Acidithrix sp. C25]|nr:unnamed protein product [Acidithrix sp. C25]
MRIKAMRILLAKIANSWLVRTILRGFDSLGALMWHGQAEPKPTFCSFGR